jgi:hypothetical protein
MTAAADVVIARRDPGDGHHASKPYLVIPDQANTREFPGQVLRNPSACRQMPFRSAWDK